MIIIENFGFSQSSFYFEKYFINMIGDALKLNQANKDELFKNIYQNDEKKLLRWAEKIKGKCPEYLSKFLDFAGLPNNTVTEKYRRNRCNMIVKEEMFHHIDNGYSTVKPKYNSILINDFWIDFIGTIDEMTDSFYFEEDEQGGFGNVQFYGECKLSGSGSNNPKVSGDFIKFRWWFTVNLVGDTTDETKIYLEIDSSLIESDLFEYELDYTNMIEDKASDFLYNNAYDIGEFIWNVIKDNATGFGYTEAYW